jgi:hypothetical protein
MDAVQESQMLRASELQTSYQVKVQKGALEQQEAVVSKILDSALPAASREGFATGQGINVVA